MESTEFVIERPIKIESILSNFQFCTNFNEVKQLVKKLSKMYHPDYCEQGFSFEECTQILAYLSEITNGFKVGRFQYAQKQSDAKTIINYASYRQSFTLASWRDFWNDELPYGKNLFNIFNNFVVLPDANYQLPIVAAFCCQNTALMNLSNTLFLYSRKAGSGKSTVAEIIAALQGNLKTDDTDPDGMSQASDTFVSLRNFIDYNRILRDIYGNIIVDEMTGKPLEKNLFLVLDDIPESKLRDEDYYNLLKAYKRQNAYIRKAERVKDENGDMVDKTKSFHVFCCKILTSCYQLFGIYDYQELTRRCLFIRCQPIEDIEFPDDNSPDYVMDNQHFKGEEFYKVSEINWKGAVEQYYLAWNEQAIERYQMAFKKLRKPQSVTTAQWEISKSLVASGYALQVWDTLPESLEAIKNYWLWFNSQRINSTSATQLVIESALEAWVEACSDPIDSAEFFPDGTKNKFYPMSAGLVNPAWVDSFLKRAEKNSELEKKPTPKVRDEIMRFLGFQTKRIGGQNYYVFVG